MDKLWKVLEKADINFQLINAISKQELYNDIVSIVKIGNKITNAFKVTHGLKQVYCLSPTLIDIYIDEAIR